MEQQPISTVEELALIDHREWGNAIKAVIHKALDTGRCPECDGSGIAVEWNLETMTRRELWCECGIEVKGQMVCAWCRLILGESGTEGQSGGICPDCKWFYFGTGKETDENS